MQIHELNTFSGTPTETDYLAIDNGEQTDKIPATSLGVSTQMSLTEAKAGTVREPRVITPATFKKAVEALSAMFYRVGAGISSLPATFTHDKITSDMKVVDATLSNPLAQTSDWTVTTSNGSLTIEGSISGTTSVTLYLMRASRT